MVPVDTCSLTYVGLPRIQKFDIRITVKQQKIESLFKQFATTFLCLKMNPL